MAKSTLLVRSLVLLAVLSLPVAARAQEGAPATTGDGGSGAATGFGVGIHALLAGPFGPAIVYGAANFHIEGILGVADDGNDTTLVAGGRFWWHLHQAAASDLSIGGGLGFLNGPGGPMGEDRTDIFIEAGAQIRFFVVDNVALSAGLGATIGAGDAEGFSITGQLTGGLGLSYFFK